MLISIAWKNIWRKPSRSLVLIFAIFIGLSGGVFSIALTEGMMSSRNDDAIDQNYSNFQIHNPKFNDFQKYKDSITNSDKIIEYLKQFPEVKSYSERLKFIATANSARSSQGVMIYGINPENEKKVTTIYKCLLDSTNSYLTNDSENEIIVSSRIAQNLMLVFYEFNDNVSTELLEINFENEIIEKLEPILNVSIRNKNSFKDSLRTYLTSEQFDQYADIITNKSTQYKLGKKIILRFVDSNGELVENAFKIIGIYKTTDAMFDNLSVFVNKKYLSQILDISICNSTEIAVMLTDYKHTDRIVEEMKAKFPNLSIKSFMDLDPLMSVKGDFIHIYYYFIIGFILFALSFGIVNTVLMSVMERTKELGMLMAIGMKKSRVFSMIMLESVFISLTGAAIGMLIGGMLSAYFGDKGLNLTAYSGALETYGFSAIIYPVLKSEFFIATTILVILTGILSSIFPAIKALKLNPSEALRSDA